MTGQAASELISLPQGGGAVAAMGETFTPDLHTGSGNLQVPISLPPGRHGLAPVLTLAYSTGQGNGPFGLGWQVAQPQLRRKTSKRIPRFDGSDVFVLSGAEDLVPVPGATQAGTQRFRPRTETLYARIEHVTGGTDHWQVWSKDGLRSVYGTPRPGDAAADWRDPAVVADPANPTRILAWLLVSTTDPCGNVIAYTYVGDPDNPSEPQRYLSQIGYAGYTDGTGAPRSLVQVRFVYEARTDRTTDRRGGFRVRTTRRCTSIQTWIDSGVPRLVRSMDLTYSTASGNATSLLTRVQTVGHDGDETQEMPPLELGYTGWEPTRRRYQALRASGNALPDVSLAHPDLDLVDLYGDGLPSVLQLSGTTARCWRNLGDGWLDRPRLLRSVPAGVALGAPGVQIADLDGDGRPDLLVTDGLRAGYFPVDANGGFDPGGYVRYAAAPAFGLADPQTRLIDLDGDGVADALRTGAVLEIYLNSHTSGWVAQSAQAVNGLAGVSFSDSRIRLADMTGDGLTDIVLIRNGRVQYWPNLGYGRFGAPVVMAGAPRFEDAALYGPGGFDERRLLLGDVDGDGCADLVYVASGAVSVWVNQCGESYGSACVVRGTPMVDDLSSVRLADMLGTGTAGLLWTFDPRRAGESNYKFLDLTGGVKPYLLSTMDNHGGGRTEIDYDTSTRQASADAAAGRPWRTTLPFPVQVVSRIVVTDHFAGSTQSTSFRYHHGYWDGAEREFRGFGRVDQFDTQAFDPGSGLPHEQYSPPTESRTWFHQGPVGPEFGAWIELDLSDEYWPGDPNMLGGGDRSTIPAALPRRGRRDAIRALAGSVLRSELYARDGAANAERPYTVTEHCYDLMAVSDAPGGPDDSWLAHPVIAVHQSGARTTQWERGTDPMTTFSFSDDYDPYGQARAQTSIAVPRGRAFRVAAAPGAPYLATHSRMTYAQRDDAQRFIVDRVARTTTYEVGNNGSTSVFDVHTAVLTGSTSLTVIGQSITFYDGDAYTGLPYGQLGDYGAAVRTENLVLTDSIVQEAAWPDPTDPNPPTMPPYLDPTGATAWTADYPAAFRTALPSLAGYIYRPGDMTFARGYFAASVQRRYDFQDNATTHRGLVIGTRDAFGQETQIAYDGYALLPVQVTDPSGMIVTAEYDYRVLQPRLVTDPNGNRTMATFTPLSLLASTALLGKEGETIGDTPEEPGTRYTYDFQAFVTRGQPIAVHSVRRMYHATAPNVPPDEIDATIETRQYSDGFGRLIQTRTQAEDVRFGDPTWGDAGLPLDPAASPGVKVSGQQRAANDPPNVVVSGWQTFDNKGRVVEKYEPFFATGWDYLPRAAAPAILFGQKITMYYDPRGQLIRTVNPDGSEQRVIYGVPTDLASPASYTPTPWETYTYDANDNAGRTHPRQSGNYSTHWNTPASIVRDALGRAVVSVVRSAPDTSPAPPPVLMVAQGGTIPAASVVAYITLTTYDIRGNPLVVTDPLGRAAFSYTYDLANRALRVSQLDSGVRRSVYDARAQVVEQRDSKGALTLHAYDSLNRPTALWARDATAQPLTLREQLVYGDSLDPAQVRAINAAGRLLTHYDEAGVVHIDGYDFKGNILSKTRQVFKDDVLLNVFANAAAVNWQVPPFCADWQPPAGQTLEAYAASMLDGASYQTTMAYDALNRLTALDYPQDVTGRRAHVQPHYNRAGALDSVTLDGAPYVERIAYNAKGQRLLIAYGNSVMTRYAYDPQMFRLGRLRTERYTKPDALTYSPFGAPLQDMTYSYDLVGNVLAIVERTPGCGIPKSVDGPDTLNRGFTYDPLYRLLTATGREADTPVSSAPWDDTVRNADPTSVRTYAEQYAYDAVNNLTQISHQATSANGANASFTRLFSLVNTSNRLATLAIGQAIYSYGYDANGNMTSEGVARFYEWTHHDGLRSCRTQAGNSEPSVYTMYLYDASGQRVKKLVRKQGGSYEVTVYVDGLFESHRQVQGSAIRANTSLHIMDNQQRVALLRRGDPFPDDASPATAYQLGDHLGSSMIVVDDSGAWTNREEYMPYGETSFGSFARKHYRYTGKERDEESGLSYHGMRYYAAWLGRWVSCDPVGLIGGLNLYTYVQGNSLNLIDKTGMYQVAPDTSTNRKVKSDIGLTIADLFENKATRESIAGKGFSIRGWYTDNENYLKGAGINVRLRPFGDETKEINYLVPSKNSKHEYFGYTYCTAVTFEYAMLAIEKINRKEDHYAFGKIANKNYSKLLEFQQLWYRSMPSSLGAPQALVKMGLGYYVQNIERDLHPGAVINYYGSSQAGSAGGHSIIFLKYEESFSFGKYFSNLSSSNFRNLFNFQDAYERSGIVAISQGEQKFYSFRELKHKAAVGANWLPTKDQVK